MRNGYNYVVTDEQIAQWKAVPFFERLEWIEEAAEFLHNIQSPKAKEITKKFRSGEL